MMIKRQAFSTRKPKGKMEFIILKREFEIIWFICKQLFKIRNHIYRPSKFSILKKSRPRLRRNRKRCRSATILLNCRKICQFDCASNFPSQINLIIIFALWNRDNGESPHACVEQEVATRCRWFKSGKIDFWAKIKRKMFGAKKTPK